MDTAPEIRTLPIPIPIVDDPGNGIDWLLLAVVGRMLSAHMSLHPYCPTHCGGYALSSAMIPLPRIRSERALR
jgi:hypothetical protein